MDNIPTDSDVAKWLRQAPEALELGQVYERLYAKLTAQFPHLADGDEYEADSADQRINGFLYWWRWGN